MLTDFVIYITIFIFAKEVTKDFYPDNRYENAKTQLYYSIVQLIMLFSQCPECGTERTGN